jgi:hypothetical protein
MPIGKNYTALDRAVFECACAGCESIWITINDDIMPLIKHRLGDYVYDPVWYFRKYDVNPKDNQKLIPIFLVPHFPKYRHRRDSPGWGIINSAIYATAATKRLSNFLTPNKFYAAFPFGIYNPRALVKHRVAISSEKNFFLTHEGKTIKDNKKLGFTFSYDDVKKINSYINKHGTGQWKAVGEFVKGDSAAWSEKLPPEERFSARKFSLAEVFGPIEKNNYEQEELNWFFDISTWEDYRNFMASEYILERPTPLKAKKLPQIGAGDD